MTEAYYNLGILCRTVVIGKRENVIETIAAGLHDILQQLDRSNKSD